MSVILIREINGCILEIGPPQDNANIFDPVLKNCK